MYLYIFTYILIFLYMYTYTYIFASIFKKFKIFHQSVLLPRNGKNLNNLQYFQIEKIRLSPQTGTNGVSNFLYYSKYLTSFPQSGKHFIVTIYLQEVQKRLGFFVSLYILLSICTEMDYISPMRFISTKWKISHQRTVFP